MLGCSIGSSILLVRIAVGSHLTSNDLKYAVAPGVAIGWLNGFTEITGSISTSSTKSKDLLPPNIFCSGGFQRPRATGNGRRALSHAGSQFEILTDIPRSRWIQ